MLRNHIEYCHVALCHGCSKHKGTCLNLIRNNRILRPVKSAYTFDLDHIRTCASDISSHAVQEVGNIYYMRLFCHIFKNRHTLCHRSCHHHIDRSSYADNVKINMASHKSVRIGKNLSVLNLHFRSKGTESLQMLIDRSASDIAPARKCHFRVLILTEKGS